MRRKPASMTSPLRPSTATRSLQPVATSIICKRVQVVAGGTRPAVMDQVDLAVARLADIPGDALGRDLAQDLQGPFRPAPGQPALVLADASSGCA